MRYQEDFTGTKAEFADFIKKVVPELFAGRLTVEGKTISIPSDVELDYKIKYDEDAEGGSVSIKVSWENPNLDLEIEEEEE
ncbi:MAG: amphi-Trp domain-containing protein [Clostridiaceae bacterium]|jgi:amphi-Trp domain-containing protein|nr:amphi-Trp domain-containing protein [Clostridiaceae bacterium]